DSKIRWEEPHEHDRSGSESFEDDEDDAQHAGPQACQQAEKVKAWQADSRGRDETEVVRGDERKGGAIRPGNAGQPWHTGIREAENRREERPEKCKSQQREGEELR